MKKLLYLLLIAFSLFVLSTLLISCDPDKTEDSELTLQEKIAKENIEDLKLTIYYDPRRPYVLSRPVKIQGLKKAGCSIVLESESLSKALPLLYNLDNSNITKLSKKSYKSYIDASVCYCLESSKNGILLEVVFWGADYSIFVNGTEVCNNAVFYDILFEYLPENIWNSHIKDGFMELSANK